MIIVEGQPLSPIRVFKIKTLKGFLKTVGWIDTSSGKFTKEINAKHRFWKAGCIGIDVELLPYLEKYKCKKVVLREGKRFVYSLPYEEFLTLGFEYPTKNQVNVKGKFQPCYMVPIEKWECWEDCKQ